MPKISVIVPVYNVEKYLHECVDSILAQTFTDFELILVNDGSQDNSGTICDEYARKDERITVIHQENQGQAASRNNAVAVASGEWIHFVDSDDLIHPQMLEILYDAVDETTRISMCNLCKDYVCPEDFCSHKSKWEFKKYQVNEESLILFMNSGDYIYWVVCAKLIKKDILLKYPFTVGRIYEDSAVAFKWINEAGNVSITDTQLYFYRVNSDSTTQVDFSLRKLDFLWAIEEQMKFYKNTDFNKIKKTVYRNYAVACSKMYYRLSENKEWAEEAKELKNKLKAFIKQKGKLIDFKEDWEFNMVYGVLYSRPIRIILRTERYIKNRLKKNRTN